MKIQTLLKVCAAASWLQKKWDGAFNAVYSIPHTSSLRVWSQQENPRSRRGSVPSCLALSREKVTGSARWTQPLLTTISPFPIPSSCGFKMWCWRTAVPSPRLLQGKLGKRREKWQPRAKLSWAVQSPRPEWAVAGPEKAVQNWTTGVVRGGGMAQASEGFAHHPTYSFFIDWAGGQEVLMAILPLSGDHTRHCLWEAFFLLFPVRNALSWVRHPLSVHFSLYWYCSDALSWS